MYVQFQGEAMEGAGPASSQLCNELSIQGGDRPCELIIAFYVVSMLPDLSGGPA